MSKWVSVEEKIPPTGFYLCSGHAGYLMLCFRRNHQWMRSPQLKRVDGITHWMKIPSLPGDEK